MSGIVTAIMFTLGILFGLVAGLGLAGRRTLRGSARKYDMIGILMNLQKGEIIEVPLKKIAGNLYGYITPTEMHFVVITPKSSIMEYNNKIERFSKRAVIGMGIDPLYVAKNRDSLARIGIASIGIDAEGWNNPTNPEDAIERLVNNLVQMSATYLSKVPVTDNMTITIAYRIPELTQGIMADQLMDSIVATTGMKGLMEGFKEWAEAVKSIAESRAKWMGSIGKVVMIVGMLLLMFVAVSLILPKLMTMFKGVVP